MAQPPAYNRRKDFAADEGDRTDNGAINNELDAAGLSINGLRENLAKIQRDDGGLRNGIVTADNLAPSLKDDLYNEFSGNINDSVLEARQAAEEATDAATAAQGFEQSAATSAGTASTAAGSAQASAQAASQSQAAAYASASSASASASAANTSNLSAADSANAAAASASSASGSATIAQTARTAAEAARDVAVSAETTAISQASTATTQAGQASDAADRAKAWASKSDGPVEDTLLSAKAYAELAQTGAGIPLYQQGTEPTTDIGTIWIEGIGMCRWSVNGHNKYCRYPLGLAQREFTAPLDVAISWTADQYTEFVIFDGVGGGGPGGAGSSPGNFPPNSGGGGGGGGSGRGYRNHLVSVVPGRTYNVFVGSRGTPGTNSNGYVGTAGKRSYLYDVVASAELLSCPGGNPGAHAGYGFGGAGGFPNGNSGATGGPSSIVSGVAASEWPPGCGGTGGNSLFGPGGLGGARSGTGGTDGAAGQDGIAYGSGGGGAGGSLATANHRFGGFGAHGFIRMRW